MSRRRPLVVLLVLAVALVGLVGLGVPSVAASAAEAGRAAQACPAVPVVAPGEPARLTAETANSRAVACWTLTPSSSGAHALRLAPRGRPRVVVTDPAGEVVADLDTSAPLAEVPVIDVEAGTTYRVEVRPDEPVPNDLDYRIGAVDLSATCAEVPAPAWDAPRVEVDLSEGRTGCLSVTAASLTGLRIETDSLDQPAVLVVDDEDAVVCGNRLDLFVSHCPTLTAGRYRVVVQAESLTATRAGLGLVPVGTTSGCAPTSLGGWGSPLPVEGRRTTSGLGQECYRLTATRTGTHQLRWWEVDAGWAEYELWDATTGALLLATAVEPRYRIVPASEAVSLVAGHDYRVVVSGRPFAEGHGGAVLETYDPTFRVGLLDAAAFDGCRAIGTDWDDPTVVDRVDAGAMSCWTVDEPAGTTIRLDPRTRLTQPGSGAWAQVLDADGRRVTHPFTTCISSAYSAEDHGPSTCELAGPGPYRVVVSGDVASEAVRYSLAVDDTSSDAGCTPMPLATWHQPLPGSGSRPAGGPKSDCWTVTTSSTGRHRLRLWSPKAGWVHDDAEVYDADGRIVGNSRSAINGALAGVDLVAGPHRIIVGGDPGALPADYRIGLFDTAGTGSDGPPSSGPSSCPALASSALSADGTDGTTVAGSADCFRLPVAVADGDSVRVRIETPRPGAATVDVVDRDGRGWCHTGEHSAGVCELEGPGPYRVLVQDDAGPIGTPYRLWVGDTTDRSGCRPASSAAAGADPVVANLAPGGASTCVALADTGGQLFWSLDGDDVDAVVIGGDGEPLCAFADAGAADLRSGSCDLDGGPAPYSVLLTGGGTPASATALLRQEPGVEPRCTTVDLTADGPAPLVGTATDDLRPVCFAVDLEEGELISLNRSTPDGTEPPDVHFLAPSRRLICSDSSFDTPSDEPDCQASTGRHVFFVVGSPRTAGPFRVDLACSSHPDCARRSTVVVRHGSVAGPVRVGHPLVVPGVTTSPQDARTTYLWLSNGRAVGSGRTYTPRPADRGHRLALVVGATAPRHHPGGVRTDLGRVAPGRLVASAPRPGLTGRAVVGSVVRARSVSVEQPVRGARVTYRWLRDGRPVARGHTYRLRPADRGHRLRLRVVVTAAGYATRTTTTPGVRVR